MLPLEDLRVLDFSTLLPGPFATLILAEAGAEVIKVERPGGEDMRGQHPKYGDSAMLFAQLNRGKKSIEIDLKDPAALAKLRPLIESADVLVEQFRPGVMDRLGLGWDAVHEINPRLVYCAITGYATPLSMAAHRARAHLPFCGSAILTRWSLVRFLGPSGPGIRFGLLTAAASATGRTEPSRSFHVGARSRNE